ncbi:MAG: DUF5701 family protein, partial [Herbiconiux sp.]|nr:DUF5701 family protein [Herbiconiux sp.]
MSAIAPDLLRPVRLPTVSEQLAVLLDAGLAERAGVSREELRTWVSPLRADATAVLVVHPCLVAPSRLVTLLRRGRRSGITAADVSDFDALEPIDGIELPAHPLYLVHAVEGGGDLAGTGAGAAGAAGALTEIGARGRR